MPKTIFFPLSLCFYSIIIVIFIVQPSFCFQTKVVQVCGKQILVNRVPFIADGAPVQDQSHFDLLRQLGGRVVRTYGAEVAQAVLDTAQQQGLYVIAGFWMAQPRAGYLDYNNQTQVQEQLSNLTDFVNRYKNHPALLLWGIGNELELAITNDTVAWIAVETAAKLVRQLDPNHPTLAVISEFSDGDNKIERFRKHCPSIQVLGMNSYSQGLMTLADRVAAQGWPGPLIVTEMGALGLFACLAKMKTPTLTGQWQTNSTAWGAPIEPSSGRKAQLLDLYLGALEGKVQGRLPFLWGNKQEVTPTWHSLLLPDGSYEQTSEVMAKHFGGQTPNRNRAPRITQFEFQSRLDRWNNTDAQQVQLSTSDPDGDAVRVEWVIMAESTANSTGGDAEVVPPSYPNATVNPSNSGLTIPGNVLPPGPYRVFIYVRDGKGAAATANLPFNVE